MSGSSLDGGSYEPISTIMGLRNVSEPWHTAVAGASAAVALAVSIVMVSKVLSSKNKRKEEAIDGKRKRLGEEESDVNIMKQGFSTRLVPDNLDAIVIGSGIGSLATASLLSQRGHRVLVLEQHDVVGGNCHTFEEGGGYEFDTGIHYVGGDIGNPSSSLGKMMKAISDEDCVRWAPMDDYFDVAAVMRKGKEGERELERFPMHKNAEHLKEDLIRQFPEERKAIERYISLVLEVNQKMKMYFALSLLPVSIGRVMKGWFRALFPMVARTIDKTSLEILSELTDNEKLLGVLCYLYGNSGITPSRMSFMHHAVIVGHYVGGGFYPVGGPAEICKPIVRKIQANGGKVLVRAPVSEILVDPASGAAIGVIVKGKKIYSNIVISGAGAVNTYKKLLPQSVHHLIKDQRALLEKVTPKTSLCSLFVGINNEDGQNLHLPRQNFWVFPSWDHEGNNRTYENDMSSPIPGAFVSFPSAKDPTYKDRHPRKEVALAVCMAEYEWFQKYRESRVKHRGKDYDDIKSTYRSRLLDMVLHVAPQIEGKIAYIDVGTPVTNDYYLGTLMGESYGMEHSPTRFKEFLLCGPRTPISGLFLTGHDNLTNGYAGALVGGYFAAIAIDKSVLLRHWWDLL